MRLEENESFGIPLNDDARANLVLSNNLDGREENEENEDITDHIKIENGQIIVSDSIAMNSSMPLE